MSVPKKHHYVPQLLLRHFADDREYLTVHRMEKEVPHPSTVRNLGHTNFGHSLYWPGREPDHTSVEQAMGEIEGATAKVISTLRADATRSPDEAAREVLGFLIALQDARSRFHIDMLEHTVLAPDEPVDEFAKSMGVRQILRSVLFPWSARSRGETTHDEVFCYIVDWLQHGPWSWRLYRPKTAALVVGDNLVCMWGVADGETSELPAPWTHHGVSLGFENCARITVPLAPDLGLVITRAGQRYMPRITAAAFNRATVYNSREFVAHHPDGLPTAALDQALRDDIRTQRWILPIIREGARRAAQQNYRDFVQSFHSDDLPF